MGGKKNQTQRTKNNAKPSSSGRSADLLGVAKPMNPFLAFSFQKDAPDMSLRDGIDPAFEVALKKMSKKDSTTKLKALQEFTSLCTNEETETDKIVAVLSFWCRQYIQLAVDIEHKVRESSHISQQAVVKRCKRNLAPYLRQIAGPWFVSQCDTHAPAATAATKAFTDAFPPNKILEAILFCQAEIIKYITDNLINQTADTLSNPSATLEEKQMKYQRILISCLHGYALYLSRVPADQLIEATNKELVSSICFWKHAKNSSPVVRSAWYTALIAICQYSKDLLEGRLSDLSKATVGNLDETEALVAPLVWETTLHALVALPDLWKVISVEKVLIPKLLSVCRKAGYGCATTTFPSLLPMISQIPAEMIQNRYEFYNNLFYSLRQGLELRSVQQSNSEQRAVVAALTECLQLCVTNHQESDPELCRKLVQSHLLPMLTSAENANPQMVQLLKSWSQTEESSVLRELFNTCCEHIIHTFSEAVSSFSKRTLTEPAPAMEFGLRPMLHKQLCVVTNLLKGDKIVSQYRNRKVNFASPEEPEEPEEPEKPSPTSESGDSSFGAYESAMCDVAARMCSAYLRAACDMLEPEFIRAILKLVQSCASPELFSRLALFYGCSDSSQIFTTFLLQWMRSPENPLCCKETVSLGLLLVFHLPSEVHQSLLDQVLTPCDEETVDPKLLLWLLEDLTTSEAKEMSHVEWIENPALKSMLIELTEKVLLPEEGHENIWPLLERVTALCVEEGHKNDGAVLKGILQVFQEHLGPDVGPETQWLVPATRVLQHVYATRGLALLSLPSDHPVIQSFFQVYLESIRQDSEIPELFDFTSKAVCAVYRSTGLDSPLFKNIVAALNNLLQNFVMSQESSQTKNVVTVGSRVATMLKSIGGDDVILFVLRKLCGPPAEPGSTVGPLVGSLSEDWSRMNALVLNADARISGGTYRGEADVSAPRYSACLAEGIPVLHSDGGQVELAKPALWALLSVVTLADVQSSFEKNDSLSSDKCSLISDTCAALAVTHHLSQYYTSIELTYHVDNIKAVSDQNWTRFFSGLSATERKQIRELLLNRAAENLGSGGRYWVRALEYWINTGGNPLSKEEASRLLLAPAEYYSTILLARLHLVKTADLPIPVLPSGGTLETLNLAQFVELSMYLLSSVEAKKENVVLQGLSALSCVHRLDSKRLLFDCDIYECKTSEVRDVVRTILFIRTVLVRYPTLLSESHWDLLLISVASWIPSLQRVVQHALAADGDVRKVEHLTSTMVCSFVASVCDLYAAFQGVLSDLRNDVLKLPEEVKKESIVDAWRDVFAAECDRRFVQLWIQLSEDVKEEGEISPMASLLFGHLSASVATASLDYLGETNTEFEETMGHLLYRFWSPIPSLRLASYHLLSKLVPVLIKKDEEAVASLADEASEGVQPRDLCIHLFGVHAQSLQIELEHPFDGVRLGESCSLEPFKDPYVIASGYLLLWMVILDTYGAANADVRFEYASFLKTQNVVQSVLHYVFRLLPQVVLRQPDIKNRITTDYFTKKFSFEFSEKWTSERLSRLACHVFLGVLIRLPAMARTWWGEVDSNISTTINQTISEHCSSLVAIAEMKEVLRHQEKAVENMAVKVHLNTREVIATYMVDDLVMELIVKLPNNYPLAPMTVEIGKGIGGGSNQWRTWLMQICIFLTHQNGSLWDGLALWRNYVVRRFEGVEECYICFCVLHGATYQLPKLSCRTCRKKFHSPCLYKWFQTSNKSTCPICRNLF